IRDLARGVFFDRALRVRAAHPDPVVGDSDSVLATTADRDAHPRGVGVETVFDEFLDDRRRSLDDLAGRDSLDGRLVEPVDLGVAGGIFVGSHQNSSPAVRLAIRSARARSMAPSSDSSATASMASSGENQPNSSCSWFNATDRSDRKSTRLNSSHVSISYALYSLPLHDALPSSGGSRCRWRDFRRESSELLARRSARYSVSTGAFDGSFERFERHRFDGFIGREPAELVVFVVQRHRPFRSEEHTSELQSRFDLVCSLLSSPPRRSSELRWISVSLEGFSSGVIRTPRPPFGSLFGQHGRVRWLLRAIRAPPLRWLHRARTSRTRRVRGSTPPTV